jgi:S1-C subfamily serine protease
MPQRTNTKLNQKFFDLENLLPTNQIIDTTANMKTFYPTASILYLTSYCSSFVSPDKVNRRSDIFGVTPPAQTLSNVFGTTVSYDSTNVKNTNDNTKEYKGGNRKKGFEKLSVTDLKRLLLERGIDFRDCLEKRDLIERLENSLDNTGTSSSAPIYIDSGLTDNENRVIRTFKRVSPSVAFIQTTSVVQTIQGMRLRGLEVPSGTGSGFLWDSKGHVVTNYHVIVGGKLNSPLPKTVKVKLNNMAEARDAIVVGVDPEKDLAVLKLVSTTNLPFPIDIGTSNNLQVGQSVLAIGNPFGLDDTLTTGVVSALGREVDGIGGRPIKGCIQTDAAINPGNSGGPLLDSSGRLIGVNTAIFSPSRGMAGNVGIGFAIPVDTVRRVVNQIIRYGKVVRPSIGINVADDRMSRSIANQVGRKLDGVLVADVVPGSPAMKAGLQPLKVMTDGSVKLGDLITDVDGQPVRQVEDLISAIEEHKEGDIVKLTVLKQCDRTRLVVLSMTLTTREKLMESAQN